MDIDKNESYENEAYNLYNDSVDKNTEYQKQCINKLEAIYKICPTDTIAYYYSSALFNLTFRESVKSINKTAKKLYNIYNSHHTADIANLMCRILYNLTFFEETKTEKIKDYAKFIEQQYLLYKTKKIAEPLAKIWHSLSCKKLKNKDEYIEKIINLHLENALPETDEAFAKILFDCSKTVNNRKELIASFLSGTLTLTSFGYYLNSDYYPEYNNFLSEFKLCSSYPFENIGRKINNYFSKLNNDPNCGEIKAEISAVLFYTMKIKNLLLVPQNKKEVGHYTKIENIKYLVPPPEEEGEIRMYNASYMNDPTEGTVLIDFLFGEKNRSDNFADMQFSDIYLSCFTTATDQLPMWSMYGNNGTGCCLVFKNSFFDYTNNQKYDELLMDKTNEPENYFLYRICYLSWTKTFSINIDNFSNDIPDLKNILEKSIQMLKYHFDNLIKAENCKHKKLINNILSYIINQIVYLFKDEAYRHEHEVRLIKYSKNPKLDKTSYNVPQLYIEVKKPPEYNKIILGPKVNETNKIIPYLNYTKKIKTIEKSKIKYR